MMAIFGSEDILSPSGEAGDYGAAPTIVIKGAGHVLFDEAPEVVDHAITSFLRERVYYKPA
jgi:pimeloyl-ACP methyl ester carboxylesterase